MREKDSKRPPDRIPDPDPVSAHAAPMVSAPPMNEAVRRAQNGDVAAFESIYRTYRGRVHAVTLRMSGDPTRAEDLTQEVFLKLWRKLGQFQGQSSFYSWLYRMAVNLTIDGIRAEKRRSGREIGTEDMEILPDRPRGNRDLAMDLEAAVARLPERARQVLVLHDVEGYRHEDIANLLGIAPGTSKAQLHRARRLLRSHLS
jgi:RNA polymerase sigma-70 factor (ECF subfamily)